MSNQIFHPAKSKSALTLLFFMSEKPIDTNLFLINRIMYTLEYIIRNNPDLNTPSSEEMSEINLKSIQDAQQGRPSGYEVTDEDF